MHRLLLSFALLVVSLSAVADGVPTGPYTPLQPAHWGNWYDPGSSGEGIDLSLIETDQGNVIFGQVYLLTPGGANWHTLQAEWSEARDPLARDYEIPTFQRDGPGQEPVRTGTVWLRPDGALLRATFAISGRLWHATLHQLTRPPGLHRGVCGHFGFSPRPPAAPAGWCHD